MVAEQANRRVTGIGIVPWEFRTASRPALLATVVEPIYRLDVSAATHRLLQSALFCCLSLIPVWVAFRWSHSLYGLTGGVVAAALMAIWFELVYFAPKATVDAVCAYLLLAGVFLVRPGGQWGAVLAGAFTLTIAVAMRVQIAPAVLLVLGLACLAGERGRMKVLLLGALAGCAAAGAVEWRWWGTPFQGQIGYLLAEFKYNVSQHFGVEPLVFYLKHYIVIYGLALPLISYLVYKGAAKAPVLLLTALTVIAPFHVVGHKEYRFVIAALPLLVLLIGLAVSQLIDAAAAPRTLGIVLGGCLVGMLAAGLGDTYRRYWTLHHNHVLAFEEIGRQPDACGIALVGIGWWETPGYSGLGSNIPIYEVSHHNRARMLMAANYVLLATAVEPPPPPYERWREYIRPEQHLYRRTGTCVLDRDSQVIRPPGPPGVE